MILYDGLLDKLHILQSLAGGVLSVLMGETFQCQIAVITDLFQRAQDLLEIQIAAAGIPAGAVGNVEVTQLASHGTDRLGEALLLQLHMEGIQMGIDAAEAVLLQI